ncbi:MAG: DnaJ domain-containing protein [Alphaproteobacteria bacterium]|nr:DnaJ domain-containing protein [Alphaproteobacteria bacterium]
MTTQRYTFFTEYPQTQTRSCDHEGCHEEGSYRAPYDRNQLNHYFWFCLDHVRTYNANWNYYEGMNETEVEFHRRADVTWERPTWPIGYSHFGRVAYLKERNFKDPFHLLVSDSQNNQLKNKQEPDARVFHPLSKEHEALIILQLEGPVTFFHIKCTYRNLVKEHHPDTNQGCKIAEEYLKKVNNAYSILKKAFDK